MLSGTFLAVISPEGWLDPEAHESDLRGSRGVAVAGGPAHLHGRRQLQEHGKRLPSALITQLASCRSDDRKPLSSRISLGVLGGELPDTARGGSRHTFTQAVHRHNKTYVNRPCEMLKCCSVAAGRRRSYTWRGFVMMLLAVLQVATIMEKRKA